MEIVGCLIKKVGCSGLITDGWAGVSGTYKGKEVIFLFECCESCGKQKPKTDNKDYRWVWYRTYQEVSDYFLGWQIAPDGPFGRHGYEKILKVRYFDNQIKDDLRDAILKEVFH